MLEHRALPRKSGKVTNRLQPKAPTELAQSPGRSSKKPERPSGRSGPRSDDANRPWTLELQRGKQAQNHPPTQL